MVLSLMVQAENINSQYRNKILSFIKENIGKIDPTYKENLYPGDDSHKIPKPFTFSLILPDGFEAIKNGQDTIFKLKSPKDMFEIRISSSDYNFAQKLYDSLNHENAISFGDGVIGKIKNIFSYEYGPFNASSLKIKFLSPILLEQKGGRPLLSNKETKLEESKFALFNSILNEVENLKCKSLNGRALNSPLELIPIDSKKRVVKHFVREFKAQTGKEMMYFTGLDGTFILSGDSDDLNELALRGIGLRTGQGFGMFEVIGKI
jgi:CRISPR-associated endoribonuclease Cas6